MSTLKQKRLDKSKILMLVLVCLQFLSICYINFFYTEKMLDMDSALAIRHAVDMWRNHTIFLKDFGYTTSMEIDCVSFFAAPIYIISGNLSFSMGLVHVFVDLILMGSIYFLLKNLNVDFQFRMLAILLVFTPYAYGQLDYANMIFLSVGQYEFRLICAILFFALVTFKGEKTNKIFLFVFFIYTIVLLMTVLSTGIYVVVATLAPAVLFEVFMILKNQKIELKKRTILILFWALLVAGVALVIRKAMAIEITRTALNIITCAALKGKNNSH